MRDRDEVKVFLYLSIGKSKLAYRETRTGLGLGLGPGLGPVQNPDSRKTRTRHSDLPSKKPDLSPQSSDSINKKTEFKTGLIKKRGFKSVAHQSVICLYT